MTATVLKNQAFLLALALLSALGLAACGGESEPALEQRFSNLVEPVFLEDGRIDPAVLAEEQVLHRGNGAQPQTLDPHLGSGVPSSNIIREMFEGLVTKTPDGRIIPGQAESWEVSEDGYTYTFTLRAGLQWSNGDPFTSEDFAYAFRRAVNPETGSSYGFILFPILNAEEIINGEMPADSLGVATPDERTLVVTLKAPTTYFLGLLTHSMGMPVHRASIEAHGDSWARPGTLVSNGPFTLTELKVQEHIRVDKNPLYWNADDVILETTFFYPIEDQSSELSRYRAGEIDWTSTVPNNQFRWVQENLGDELTVAPYLGIYYYGFNTTRPPFKDNPALRKALSLAIDRKTLTEKITQFGEIPAYTFVPGGIPSYPALDHPWAKLSAEERLAEARRLYAEAGYSQDNPLKTEIRYNTSEGHKRVAVAIQAMWQRNLGVEATLVNEEWKVFLQNRNQKEVTEVYRGGWIGDYEDANTFLEIHVSGGGLNDTGYSNPAFDALMTDAAKEKDADARRAMLQEAERLLLEDHPVMPVYYYVDKKMTAPYVGGWENNILNYHYGRYMYILKH